jgi:hypothetical protein
MTEHYEDADMRRARDTDRRKSPPAPGASASPQKPGMTPDRSSVPGHFSTRVAPPLTKRRPLTQYGTAEEIMKVFKKVPEEQVTAKSFEQATASYEELRKAYPWELPPVRPSQPAIAAGESPEALPATTSEF